MAQPAIPNPIKTSSIQTGLTPKAPAQPKKSQRSSLDIIRQSAQRETPGADVNKLIVSLGTLIDKNVVGLLRLGDTVLMLQPKGDGVVEFHTFTIENPQQLPQRYKEAIPNLKRMGFKKAISYAQSPAFKRIAEQSGVPVKVTQEMRRVGAQMMPYYKFEVDL
jgi:hypothetical protein